MTVSTPARADAAALAARSVMRSLSLMDDAAAAAAATPALSVGITA